MPQVRFTDYKSLARAISLVENESAGYEDLLRTLQPSAIPVIGFTGPPGAGKSTLLNALVGLLLDQGKKVGLVLVDPSSPFNFGALLGDRLRMSAYFNHPNLFIRSLASRGSMGGLSDKIVEVLEVMKAFAFDYILVETVGVGQGEVEIAGLADTTVVVLVPEAGDGVQTMKAGLMEIADIYVINKADRPDAESLFNSLQLQLQIGGKDIPVLKTVAVEGKGVEHLLNELQAQQASPKNKERRALLMSEKALRLIAKIRMRDFDKAKLKQEIAEAMQQPAFNLYSFISRYC
ncbi:MAG: methylmalonyl Co-A mutase-associated GTPase MeaB [Chitinophagales bacterium]